MNHSENLLVKSLLKIVFDYLKQKVVNKTTCRAPLANPRILCAHYLENLWTGMIIFWAFLGFPDLFGKVLLASFNFS